MIFTIKGKRICYNPSPKCGSTAMKRILLDLSGIKQTADPEWPHVGKYESVHFKKERADYKFCVVRDPVDRFISGYTDRIMYHGYIPYMPFEEFVTNFQYYQKQYEEVEHHFRPQTAFIGNKVSYYDKVYYLNDLEKCLLDLESLLDINITRAAREMIYPSKKPVPAQEQISFIQDMYRKDYDFIANRMSK